MFAMCDSLLLLRLTVERIEPVNHRAADAAKFLRVCYVLYVHDAASKMTSIV